MAGKLSPFLIDKTNDVKFCTLGAVYSDSFMCKDETAFATYIYGSELCQLTLNCNYIYFILS